MPWYVFAVAVGGKLWQRSALFVQYFKATVGFSRSLEGRGCRATSRPDIEVRMAVLWRLMLIPLAMANMASGANPIRKVVNLLQNMKAKVEKEGDTEQELYEKFQCYCKKNIAEADQNLKTNQEKLPPLQKTLESTVQNLNQLSAQIQSAKTERQEAEEALAEATTMRQKEKADFEKSSQEQKATIESIEQAVKALTKGMASAFLQTEAAESLRRFAFNRDGMVEADRQELLAFLQNGADYVPQSGQILGMLKQMGSETHEAMVEAQEVEAKAQQEFKELSAAKTKEIKALTVSIEEKMEQLGELKVAVVRLKSSIQEAETAVAEDQKVLQSLHSSCNKKAAAWDARVKTRGEELMAISETIKILNDDDALESFKKALPQKTSFLQVDSTLALKERVRRTLEAVPGAKTDLILLALRGKKIGFDKVVQMITSMKATLKKEQENEDKKKEYCKQQFDSSDDKKRSLLLQVSNKETNIDSAKDALKMMETEIQELKDGLEKLDQDVAEATEQRKKEHEAQSLLKVAKERMMQFYASPSLVEVEQKGPEEEHQEYIQQKVNPVLENLVTQLLLERPELWTWGKGWCFKGHIHLFFGSKSLFWPDLLIFAEEQLAPFMIKWLSQNSKTPAAAAFTEGVEMEKLQEEVKDLEKQVQTKYGNGIQTPDCTLLQAAASCLDSRMLETALVYHTFVLTSNAARNLEETEEEEEEVDEIEPPPAYLKKGPRNSVSAEAYGQFNPEKVFVPPVYPKSEEQKERLSSILKDSFLFAAMDSNEVAILIDAMQDADGKHFECTAGDAFGELALLYNCPRAASVEAAERSVLWALDRESFNNIVKKAAVAHREQLEEFLQRVPLLQTMEVYERSSLCDALQPVTFREGEVIVHQGEIGETFYLLEELLIALFGNSSTASQEGTAVVSKVYVPGTPPKEVMRLGHGDYFGELALLNNDLRAASVTCASATCRCLALSRRTFDRLLGPLEERTVLGDQAPETFGSNYAKSSQASGAVGLLTSLIGDTARQMSEAEAEEKEDQKDYEEIMQDSSKKRESDSRSIAQKTTQKADLASDLQVLKGGKASAEKELAATKDYAVSLPAARYGNPESARRVRLAALQLPGPPGCQRRRIRVFGSGQSSAWWRRDVLPADLSEISGLFGLLRQPTPWQLSWQKDSIQNMAATLPAGCNLHFTVGNLMVIGLQSCPYR
eukprot:s180_g53.t1